MGVSTVLDPTVFNGAYFNKAYQIHARNLLDGIEKDGLLVVDSESKLRNAIFEQIESLPTKHRQQLQIRLEELFKNKRERVVECCILSNYTSSENLLDLAYHLRIVSEADTLIVGSENLEMLKVRQGYSEGIFPLSEYNDSYFEKERQRDYVGLESTNVPSESEIEDTIIHSAQFNNWLASIVNEEIFPSRERLVTLLAEDAPHEELEEEFREFFEGYCGLAFELSTLR